MTALRVPAGVLDAIRATPPCELSPIDADLSQPWCPQLLIRRFDHRQPTAWVLFGGL
ncbi:UNVERIFIED_ORG: O-methyltransferase involved in polyketide biosynthesis [Paenarthrobacter nicotinovorans]